MNSTRTEKPARSPRRAVGLMLPEDLIGPADELAARRHISRNTLIVQLLTRELEAEDKTQHPTVA